MNRPECLHIPTLHEGEQAQISWGAVEANNDYIVERVFNETFYRLCLDTPGTILTVPMNHGAGMIRMH